MTISFDKYERSVDCGYYSGQEKYKKLFCTIEDILGNGCSSESKLRPTFIKMQYNLTQCDEAPWSEYEILDVDGDQVQLSTLVDHIEYFMETNKTF